MVRDREIRAGPASSQTLACAEAFRLGTGRSPSQSPPVVVGMASGRPEAVADDEREGEVGPARNSREASEQSGSTRWNNLMGGLAVSCRQVQADIRTYLIHRPARGLPHLLTQQRHRKLFFAVMHKTALFNHAHHKRHIVTSSQLLAQLDLRSYDSGCFDTSRSGRSLPSICLWSSIAFSRLKAPVHFKSAGAAF